MGAAPMDGREGTGIALCRASSASHLWGWKVVSPSWCVKRGFLPGAKHAAPQHRNPSTLSCSWGHCGPWGHNSSALGSSTAQGHQRPSHSSHPHGHFGISPQPHRLSHSVRDSSACGFQEKGYKNSLQDYVFLEHLHKAWGQIKKPSTSIIQNIVAVQDTINAAFIQIPTAWDCGHVNGKNIYEKEWELCAT